MPSAATVQAQWVFHPRRSEERARSLAAALDAPMPVAHALVNRGLDTEEAARRFLEPALENLHDPRQMKGLEEGATRILDAVARGERILVQGDYDVDGITSTFLLHSVLRDLGARVEYRIPDRAKDGYGLTPEAIEEARRRQCSLVVTVDCGITAVESVDRAAQYGIDVVITDHHEPARELPRAFAVINPQQPGCGYPFRALAGVGVTFKLSERLLQGKGGIDHARRYLDVVALGTIADVVPLVGENRILASAGLELLNRGERPGLKALKTVARLEGKHISSSHVAFVLAPRINAAGRMGDAEQGLRLLMATQAGEAQACADALEGDNNRRRERDRVVLQEAEDQIRALPADSSAYVLWSKGWHVGVIGIVASRLVERYRRPAILIALEGERGRGSGRSLPGLNLVAMLEQCSDLLVTHGGHAIAAGLSVTPENLEALRERVERLVREQHDPARTVPRIEVDDELDPEHCGFDLVDWVERLSPHGLDNPEPVFQMLGVRLEHATAVGNRKHLRLRVRGRQGTSLDAIGFGMGDQVSAMQDAGRADLLFVPTRNEWDGESRVQLKLKAARPA
jgi:single-stranded-DNA-specific exonuclease